jgi:hypothetical protein
MNRPYSQTHRVTPTGIATASILLVALVMAASLLFDQPAGRASAGTAVTQTIAHVRG